MSSIVIDIPNLPGVPALPSYSPNDVVLLVADAVGVISLFAESEWGIFLDGAQAFPYNSVLDVDYKRDLPVSDYPVEEGGFQSYDKVQLPFDVRVRVVSGPMETDRQELILAVEQAADGLELYDVVTPETTYSNCNITHFDYRRQSHNGVGIVIMDIWFVEIRPTSTTTFSTTQNPTVAGQQNTGNVSPQSPASKIQQNFDSGQTKVN